MEPKAREDTLSILQLSALDLLAISAFGWSALQIAKLGRPAWTASFWCGLTGLI
jgi:hypothetical protein